MDKELVRSTKSLVADKVTVGESDKSTVQECPQAKGRDAGKTGTSDSNGTTVHTKKMTLI